MKRIESKDNTWFKYIKKLSQSSSFRRQEQRALIEGIHSCDMFLAHQFQPVYAIFSEHGLQKPDVKRLLQQIPDDCVYVLPEALLSKIEDVEQGQGVLFIIDRPLLTPSVSADNLLLLDRIQDPGNLGTILRTALAVGIRQIYLSAGCVDVWSPKVIRSAQGAHFSLALYEQVDLVAHIAQLNIPILVTSLNEHAQSLYELELPRTCAWVFGNEGQGVSVELQALATHCIFIPQEPEVESLNVGVACGVCLFEQYRQFRR